MAVRATAGTRLPSRPAPPPPFSRSEKSLQRASSLPQSHVLGIGHGSNKGNAPPLLPRNVFNAGKKKVPPPRPPPPKIAPKNVNPPSYSEVMAELMHTNKKPNSLRLQRSRPASLQIKLPSMTISNQPVIPTVNEDPAPLIDLSTPPGSPSPTQRSSSDGMSLNSFGSNSDSGVGNNSANSQGRSSSSSGFEDDFDPFSSPPPLPVPAPRITHQVRQDSVKPLTENSPQTAAKPFHYSKPTVIRPGAPKPRYGKTSAIVQTPSNSTPPMPRVPPPAPPPETIFDEEILPESLPELPPRPGQQCKEPQLQKVEQPYAIALYEFPATQATDLALQPNDHIYLEQRLNSEWLYGCCGSSSGMFPASFVEVVVPLPGEGVEKQQKTGPITATALYTFVAEAPGDLGFQEGAFIEVLRHVNEDWLLGECEGRQGHFPASFVTIV